jgi:Zn-finger nucleic acid-binding protein
MLVLCRECQRQFDVTGLAPGQQLRCLCGHVFVIETPVPHEARTLHCSGCGGKLDEAATKCGYCGGSISVDERGLGAACPKCFARLLKGARFCRECGIAIRPEAFRAVPISASCPRCVNELVRCELDEAQFTECSGCGGIWLDAGTFDRVVEERDRSAIGAAIAGRASREKPLDTQLETSAVKYLPCPICSQMMNRKNFAGCSGVIIDWCRGHGFWFDTHELEKVIDFVRGGGMDKAREQDIARARSKAAQAERHANWVRSKAASGGGHFALGDATYPAASSLVSVLGTALRTFLRW